MDQKLSKKEISMLRRAFNIAKAKSYPAIETNADFAKIYLKRSPSVLSKFFSGDYYSFRVHRKINDFVVSVDKSLAEMIPHPPHEEQEEGEGEVS